MCGWYDVHSLHKDGLDADDKDEDDDFTVAVNTIAKKRSSFSSSFFLFSSSFSQLCSFPTSPVPIKVVAAPLYLHSISLSADVAAVLTPLLCVWCSSSDGVTLLC